MKVVLLAGGLGTRLSEETVVKPKPMVEIGGIPILEHIMNTYAAYDYTDFIVACGYKGEVIKDYFASLHRDKSDLTVHLKDGVAQVTNSSAPDWTVSMVDTGLHTMTGGRILRLKKLLRNEPFMVTYGDGVSDINIEELVKFHRSHGKLATVTAVRPPARFGGLEIEDRRVKEFSEKPQAGEGWINGGYFVFEPQVLEYLSNDETILEREPLERLAADQQLMAYQHAGFWQPMDTLREKQLLESLWNSGKAPWKVRA